MLSGGSGQNRTADTRIFSPLLHVLEVRYSVLVEVFILSIFLEGVILLQDLFVLIPFL